MPISSTGASGPQPGCWDRARLRAMWRRPAGSSTRAISTGCSRPAWASRRGLIELPRASDPKVDCIFREPSDALFLNSTFIQDGEAFIPHKARTMRTVMDQASPFVSTPRRDIQAGLRDIAPVAVAALPIGLLFGAVAAAKGMSTLEVGLMSALVFAGGAQFAAIETWISPAPILTLAFATLLINARHVLMGASLTPKVRMSRVQTLLAYFFLTDEAWALSERRALERPVTGAYWFAMAVVLWANWTLSSTVGAILGSFLGSPERIGADFAFTALFIGLVAGFGKSRVTLVTVAASAGVAALVHYFIGAPWHVASGALAGIAAAYLAASDEARP